MFLFICSVAPGMRTTGESTRSQHVWQKTKETAEAQVSVGVMRAGQVGQGWEVG